MCQPRVAQCLPGTRAQTSSQCGCGCLPSFRRFFSAKEEAECLETYRSELKKELAGVEERLNELKEQASGIHK